MDHESVADTVRRAGSVCGVSEYLFSGTAISVYVQCVVRYVQCPWQIPDSTVFSGLFVNLQCGTGYFYGKVSSYGSLRCSLGHADRTGNLSSTVFLRAVADFTGNKRRSRCCAENRDGQRLETHFQYDGTSYYDRHCTSVDPAAVYRVHRYDAGAIRGQQLWFSDAGRLFGCYACGIHMCCSHVCHGKCHFFLYGTEYRCRSERTGSERDIVR